MKIYTLCQWIPVALLALSGCGGGGGHHGGQSPGGGAPPGSPPPPTFTVSVAVTGVSGELVVQNNASDDLSVKTNGTFPFTKPLAASATYEVTIKTVPANQRCDLGPNAKGMIGTSNVTVTIACTTNSPNSHQLSVDVTGLTGTLKLHACLEQCSAPVETKGADLTVTNNGISSFPPQSVLTEYAITVTTQPDGQQCVVGPNGSGTIGPSDNIVDVIIGIACHDIVVASHVVSVNVTGLTGQVELQNNGGDDLTVPANGLFPFNQPVPVGSSYNVTFKMPPTGQTCQIPAASGTMSATDVVLDVSCQPNPPITHTLSVAVSGLDSAGGNSIVLHNNTDPDVT